MSLANEHETMVGTSRPYSKVLWILIWEVYNQLPYIPRSVKIPVDIAITLFLTEIINVEISSTDPTYC